MSHLQYIQNGALFRLCLIGLLFASCAKDKNTDEAALKMQDFVISIAHQARAINPEFIIIPQNGVELAYLETDQAKGFCEDYLCTVDGFGVEELFYDGTLAVNTEWLDMLRELAPMKKIFVSDYITDRENISDAIQKNLREGFICFPRNEDNYDYWQISDSVINVNDGDIDKLEMAQNYLYMISADGFSSKEDMINALVSTNFDLLLIDLFFEDTVLTRIDLENLKIKANGGKRLVICYLNIGSAENFRYYWKDDWKLHHPSWIKKKYEGYEDEYWVEFWADEWQNIIYIDENSYLAKILDAGFDGVYLDNVEGYYFLYNE